MVRTERPGLQLYVYLVFTSVMVIFAHVLAYS